MSTKKKNISNKAAAPAQKIANSVQQKLSQAIAHQNARQFDQAKLIYEEILKADPKHFDALHLLGVIYLQRDQYDLANHYLEKAIAINPKFPDALFHRGLNYKMQYQLDLALQDYQKTLEINPDHQNALLEAGCIYEASEFLEDALVYFDKAIKINPEFVLARLNRSNVLRRLKRFDEAMQEADIAIQKAPNYALTYSSKAMVLTDQHQFDLAMELSDRAIALGGNNSELAQLYSQRGIIYRGMWKLEEAAAAFQKAVDLGPNLVDAYANLGLALSDLGKLELAIPVYEKGLSINPHHHSCRFNYAMSMLMSGNLADGFLQYECRRNMFNWGVENKQAQWTGKEWLGDKTILVLCEQGMGDTIQFARYVSILSSLAGKVIFQVQPPLMSIMSSLEGNFTLVPEGAPHPPYDYYCFLLSLPHLFGTELSSVPARPSYLKAPAEKVQYWKERLSAYKKKRVGLVWSGGFRADRPELWAVNNRRNIAFEKIARLLNDQVDWFSLQKGEPAESELAEYERLSPVPLGLHNYTTELKDFSDTAALIENLDLVIAVDTSTAHLAAALGKPTWVLNRFDTCWRWLLERSDTPWYPSMKLYRQTKTNDWDAVIERISSDLVLFNGGSGDLSVG